MSLFTRPFTLAVAALLVTGNAAFCDDFLLSGASARATATGGAWLPSSASPTDAMAINPAGLTLLSAPTLDLSLAGGLARGQFVNAANTDGRLSANGAIPTAAFGTPIGYSRFSFGLAALPVMLSSSDWHYNDAPGGVGGVSYGPLKSKSDIFAVRLAAGLGVDLGPRVKIGATVGVVYNTNTLETAYNFQQQPQLAGLKALLDLHTHGIGWNGSVGTLLRVSEKLQVGVTYKTRTTIASKGTATGNAGLQLARIGLGAARPDFRYDAEVDNIFPQSVTVNVIMRLNLHTRLVAQGEWINWNAAFHTLPVILTRGNNADINSAINSTGITDGIPLDWRDQYTERVGVERTILEHTVIRGGFAHTNSPVPASTLSPLTAAITTNSITAGAGHTFGRYSFDGAYTIDPMREQDTTRSALKSGEFDNSRVKVGTQSVILTLSMHL